MTPLETLVRQFELDWMVDSFQPTTAAVGTLEKALEEANAYSEKRFGHGVFPMTVSVLENEVKPHPYRVEAFLQAMAATSNPEILVMVWRILSGWDIGELKMVFDGQGGAFSLDVGLRDDAGAVVEWYHSDRIEDAAIVRHFGIARMNGRPYFDGFYPLHLKG